MTIKDFVSKLAEPVDIKIKENGEHICDTKSNSALFKALGKLEIVDWYVITKNTFYPCIVINIKGEYTE